MTSPQPSKKRGLAPLAYAILLYWISDQPSSGLPSLPPGTDKIAHIILYAPLAVALAWAWRASKIWPVVLIGLLYGLSDEIHQLYVLGRSGSIADVLADGVGLFVGAWWMTRRSNLE